jgi:hypothetical protein
MTTTETSTDDQEFRDRMGIEGWLSQHLTEELWGHYGTLSLGGVEFEVADPEGIPGFDEDDGLVYLRRKMDGKIFEVEVEVTARAARDQVPASSPAVPEMAGQLSLPGVTP